MRRFTKSLTSILLVLLLTVSCVFVYAAGVANVEKFQISNTGQCRVAGYATESPAGTQVAFLHTKKLANLNNMTGDDIYYIDQIGLGNNGSFVFNYGINLERNPANTISNTMSTIHLGFQGDVETIHLDKKFPLITGKVSFDTVNNNSQLIGDTLYNSDVLSGLTDDNIKDAFRTGKNQSLIKVGGKWYDLLDPKCTSSDYLKNTANAVTDVGLEFNFDKYRGVGVTLP